MSVHHLATSAGVIFALTASHRFGNRVFCDQHDTEMLFTVSSFRLIPIKDIAEKLPHVRNPSY